MPPCPLPLARRRPGTSALLALLLAVGVVLAGVVHAPSANALSGSNAAVGLVSAPGGNGYAVISAAGGQYNYGGSGFSGSLAGTPLAAPIVGAVSVPGGGDSKWFVASDGGVFSMGSKAAFYGSMGGKPLSRPVVSVIASPSGKGYVLVGADGGTFTFGDYPFPGSLVGLPLNAPIVGAARYAGTTGLWLVGADGGVFTLTAPFYGSATGEANAPAAPASGTVGGDNGGRVTVTCPSGGSIVVSATLKTGLTNLLADARKAGHVVCGSGWRSSDQQIALRRQNCGTSQWAIYDKPSGQCSPATARPGFSMHERGLAVDFSTSSAGYSWLKANSSKYGLHLLTTGTERWHFSTNGS